MQEAGLEGIRKAVTRRQNTVTQYIATRPILDLYEQAMQRVGVRVSRRWWDQEEIELKAAKERTAEAIATASESESESESELESEAEVEAESEVGGEEISASSGVSGPSRVERSEDPWETKGHTDGTLIQFTT